MSHHRSSSHHHHHHHRSRSLPPQNPPYILDISSQGVHPRRIATAADIRAEIAAPDRPGWHRVLVLRSLDGDVGAVVGARCGTSWAFLDGAGVLAEAVLWRRNFVLVLLLDGVAAEQRRWREDARSYARRSRGDGVYVSSAQKSVLEERLWEKLGDGRSVEDVLADVIYTSWLDVLDTLPQPQSTTPDSLWKMIQALEHNATTCLKTAHRHDYTILLTRLHQRIQLTLLLLFHTAPSSPSKDANAQSLDRITYLGGLLLPLTVVSGILSIEGTYGPEGSAFWVFWLAAGLSSVGALLVIYADRLRTLHVWVGEDLVRGDEERAEDGGRERRWRRRELGWAGAVKKMSGWYWWKGSQGLEWKMPEGWEERVGRSW